MYLNGRWVLTFSYIPSTQQQHSYSTAKNPNNITSIFEINFNHSERIHTTRNDRKDCITNEKLVEIQMNGNERDNPSYSLFSHSLFCTQTETKVGGNG